jgi:hypothetical protein
MNDQLKLYEERIGFLHDMIFFYGSNAKRRAMGGGCCYSRHGIYLHPSGLCCAIGRHIPTEKRSMYLTGSINNLFLYDPKTNTDTKVNIENFLPEKIYRLGLDFLTAVAALHDGDVYWNDDVGLTWTGQEAYNRIVRTFCSTKFHTNYENDYITGTLNS